MVIRVIHDIPHCNGSIILATQAGDEYILLYDAPVQSKHFDGFGIWNEGNKKGNPNFEVFSRITIFKLFFYHVNFLSHFLKKTNNLKISVGDKETLFFLHFFLKIFSIVFTWAQKNQTWGFTYFEVSKIWCVFFV